MASRAILRPAVDLDYVRFFAMPPPACWSGIAAEDPHMLLGLGGVYLGQGDRWWCFFAKARGVRGKLLMQKAATILLDGMRQAGLGPAYALADPAIAGSDFWLSRLGFAATEDMHKQHRIWQWTP